MNYETAALADIQAKHRGVAVEDDGAIAMVVRYTGSSASCLIGVDASGNITSKIGALGSESSDANFKETGGTGGTIDVSDANADTFGEIVDTINALDDYDAYLVGVLRADDADASTGSLLQQAEAQAKSDEGIALYTDTSKVLDLTVAISNKSFEAYESTIDDGFSVDDDDVYHQLQRIVSLNTFGSGTSKIQVYEMDSTDNTETKIWEQDGGATTVEQTITMAYDATSGLKTSETGKYLLVRMIGSAACTGRLAVMARTIEY